MGKILACEVCGVELVTQTEMTATFQNRLDRLNILCDGQTAERLAIYQTLLSDWNQRVNLTSDASFEATLDRHFLDSIAPLAVEGLFPRGARLIDVGTGAGFPGLPLAIARPDLDVLLLDSLKKRLTFLEAVVAELGLTNVRTLHARAEDGAHNPACRECFDVAVARAVASAPVLMELLLPFVRTGGKAVCYKGPSAEDEMSAAKRASHLLGGGVIESVPIPIPTQPEWQHCVLVCAKEARTPREFPRKAGTPAKAPLG